MKILVTGAAGYIGSHFLHRALDRYPTVEVIAFDDLSEGHTQAIPDKERVSYHQVNISESDKVHNILKANTPDAIVHFAANAYVGESQRDPFKYFDNNVIGSLKLFKVMEALSIRKIIFSSSCTTYGDPQYMPLDEKHPQEPVNVYGTTKLMIEKALKALSLSSDWSFVCLRYFNASGADDSGLIGESHDPETHLIPLILKTALGEREQLSVFGDDYDTKDGTCIRDYVHVNDLADAHCLALERIMKEPLNTGINLGSSEGASVMEVIKLCEEVTGKNIAYKIEGRRAGDPSKLVADYEKAREILGWQPKYDLRKIIETAWRWECSKSY